MIQVDYPTSSPWVTSVGGTSLAIGRNELPVRDGVGHPARPAGPSGKSWQYTLPGHVPGCTTAPAAVACPRCTPSRSTSRAWCPAPGHARCRTAASHDPDAGGPGRVGAGRPGTGFLVGQTTLQPNGKSYPFSLSRIGGTSVACPSSRASRPTPSRPPAALGFANPAIYQRYGTAAFRDVTDHPLGPGSLAEVRANYTDPSTKGPPSLPAHARHRRRGRRGAAGCHGLRRRDRSRLTRHYIQTFFR